METLSANARRTNASGPALRVDVRAFHRIAAGVIRRVMLQNVRASIPELRVSLELAYPFDPRQSNLRMIWAHEVERALSALL